MSSRFIYRLDHRKEVLEYYGGGGVLRGGADNVLVNLTICEDFVKIPKTHNRYLSKFPGDARHRAKPSRQVFAMSIASSSLPERF